MLAKRLTQRGVVLSGGALAMVLAEKAASACVPVPLAVSTTKAAVAVAAGQAAAPSLVSAKVATLMEGVIKGMLLTKLKTVPAVLLALCVVAFGGGLLEHQRATGQQNNAQKEDAKPKDRKADVLIPDDGKKNDFRVEVVPGTQVQRFSVNAQQGSADQPPSHKTDSSKSLDEQKLHGEWIGKHDGGGSFSVFSLIFGPGKTVRRITENGLDDTGTYSVDWSKNPHHLDLKLNIKIPATQTIMEFVEPGKIRIEIGVGDEARPKAFTDETIVLTRKEKHPPGSQQATKDADRDIEIAEFYRRTGKFGTAHFYFQLVQRRYPGTNFAEKAKQGLEDLKKHRIRFADGSEGWETPAQPGQPQPPAIVQEAPTPGREVHEIRQQVKALESRLAVLEDKGKPQPPAKTSREGPAYGKEIHDLRQQVKNLESRLAALEAKGNKKGDAEKELPKVGTIIVAGNTKLDPVIRKEMQLIPGQILDDKALRIAEKNLAAFDATIEVIDTNDPRFKDILVRVKKK
jgi:polyhydroxyalkanoate synthesis regulator phasin/F0F1-type ATP synthase assembly protein I